MLTREQAIALLDDVVAAGYDAVLVVRDAKDRRVEVPLGRPRTVLLAIAAQHNVHLGMLGDRYALTAKATA